MEAKKQGQVLGLFGSKAASFTEACVCEVRQSQSRQNLPDAAAKNCMNSFYCSAGLLVRNFI
jgi:hypothetical protein